MLLTFGSVFNDTFDRKSPLESQREIAFAIELLETNLFKLLKTIGEIKIIVETKDGKTVVLQREKDGKIRARA